MYDPDYSRLLFKESTETPELEKVNAKTNPASIKMKLKFNNKTNLLHNCQIVFNFFSAKIGILYFRVELVLFLQFS